MAARARRTAGTIEKDVFATAHQLSVALHRVGAMDDLTMREMDLVCLPPPKAYGKADVARIRRMARMSQPVFAKLLGVGKSAVAQWESGDKRPSGTALRVLELLDPELPGSPVLDVRATILRG